MKGSLKGRLLLILLALTLFTWIGSALVTYNYASRVLQGQIDRQLAQYADLVGYITELFEQQLEDGVTPSEPGLEQLLRDSSLQPMLIDRPGRARSGRAGPGGNKLEPAVNIFMEGRLLAALTGSPHFVPPRAEGLSFHPDPGSDRRWRVYSHYHEPTGLWILVGVEFAEARRAMLSILGRALAPLMIILPLTLALFYFGVSRGLRPLQALATQISRRSPGQLEPVEMKAVPLEMRPVVAALNRLLERLALVLESEQRFTANAAHELMTPLAAIKTEVQVCQRQTVEEAGLERLQRIAERVDRAGHTVEQLLTLARLDPDLPLTGSAVVLEPLITEMLAESGHLAAESRLQLELELDGSLAVRGNGEALVIMLRNLLINAFRYARVASKVVISLQRREAGVEFLLCNDCEPLPAIEFSRIGERFYRVPGSAGPGAGLGLSIVRRIAEQHGAEFLAGPGAGGEGFCARVIFPA